MRDQKERIRDIIEAIEQIEKYAVQGRQSFDQNELIQTWMVHHIQVLGEACRALPQQFKEQYPDVPWKNIINMRTILVHHYFVIDKDEVWAVIENDLPDLRPKIEAILKELENAP